MKDLVHAYLDGELSLTEQLNFEQHLSTCPQCEQAYQSFSRLREGLRQPDLRYELPPQLREKLRGVTQSSQKRMMPFVFGRVLAMAATFAILLVGGSLLWSTHVNQRSLAQDLVDAHVRSMLANHLMDVASTDQHTVKPWFDGKLDFAPPVVDLAAKEFPLIGGRLDYLRNHPAAAMIYQHRKHIINVFVWPENGTDEAIRETTLNGYQLIEWRHNNMREAAVSDLNLEELKQFVGLLH
ncbi:MAG TPA: anti-sigma factor [Tepidisphaeraceae bacterium]|nr:anti-sigma factor [Tepidisphaeraceae bacterium]